MLTLDFAAHKHKWSLGDIDIGSTEIGHKGHSSYRHRSDDKCIGRTGIGRMGKGRRSDEEQRSVPPRSMPKLRPDVPPSSFFPGCASEPGVRAIIAVATPPFPGWNVLNRIDPSSPVAFDPMASSFFCSTTRSLTGAAINSDSFQK